MNQNVSPGCLLLNAEGRGRKITPGLYKNNRCNLSTHLYILLVNVRCFENCRSVLSIKMIFFSN